MITVKKFREGEMVVNAELIEVIEATPDTIISLTTGKKYMVLDTVDEIVDKVIEYRKKIHPLCAPDSGESE